MLLTVRTYKLQVEEVGCLWVEHGVLNELQEQGADPFAQSLHAACLAAPATPQA